MKKIIALLALTLISNQALCDKVDLPDAPKGFKWLKILKDESALLKPDGWFFKEDHRKGTDAYFVTKENIEEKGSFQTGLSLNVIYNIDKKSGASPTRYAESMIHYMGEDEAKEILRSNSRKNGPFTTLLCRIKDQKPGEEDVIIHYFFIANDETGTLWMYFFEAPESEWDKAWETGSVLLKYIVVESEL